MTIDINALPWVTQVTGGTREPEPRQSCGHPWSEYDPEHRECKACAALARSVEDA
jgi:hypothetical protein